jgi:hypothetical protein
MHRAMSAKALVVLVGLAAPLLAGCETASSIFGGSSPEASASIAPGGASGVTTSSTAKQAARIAIVSVSGTPDNVTGMLTDWVAESLEKQQVAAARGKDATAEYYLRGVLVASMDVKGTKLNYIWDLTDKAGSKRIHRFEGEQIVKASNGAKDPWAAVDPKVVQGLAVETATKIAKWLPPSSSAAPAVAQGAAPQPQRAVASGAGIPATTASIGRQSDGTAFIAPVVGAPGDGPSALTAAIRRELERKSIPLVDQAAASSNRVEGRVSMSQPAGGKQVVQIEWVVTDPTGNQIGVVTQKNTIQQGSLDGAWGQTADAAASAAAVKISSLLKK